MKHVVRQHGMEAEFHIDSAGLYSGHAGSMPDERMQEHALKRGYVLDSRARGFYPAADFADFDMIIGMDAQNLRGLRQLAENDEESNKIFSMMSFAKNHKEYKYVPDPYYEGPEGFEIVLDLLEDAVTGLYDYCMNH